MSPEDDVDDAVPEGFARAMLWVVLSVLAAGVVAALWP